MKKKILYSDLPRPYDAEAERLVRGVGIAFGILFVLALCLIAVSL